MARGFGLGRESQSDLVKTVGESDNAVSEDQENDLEWIGAGRNAPELKATKNCVGLRVYEGKK